MGVEELEALVAAPLLGAGFGTYWAAAPAILTAVLPAVLVFGLGVAINVAPLTATAMSSAPAEHAGVASAVNNDVARAASLIAVAVLPALAGITGQSYLHPAALAHGFKMAAIIAAAFCAAGGVLAAFTIRNPGRDKSSESSSSPSYCALEATPLQVPLGPAPRTMTWTRPRSPDR